MLVSGLWADVPRDAGRCVLCTSGSVVIAWCGLHPELNDSQISPGSTLASTRYHAAFWPGARVCTDARHSLYPLRKTERGLDTDDHFYSFAVDAQTSEGIRAILQLS